MKFPIALQLYSVRDLLEKDLEGGLKQVKELGYDGVELAGLYDHTAAEVKEILDRVGIQAVSAHVPFTDMLEDPEGGIERLCHAGLPVCGDSLCVG